MGKINRNTIEIMKDILIVVLVLTTVLLLYFLWANKPLEAFIFKDGGGSKMEMSKVIKPAYVRICKGNQDFMVVDRESGDIWENQLLEDIRDFARAGNPVVEEITEKQYKEVMQYPSIAGKFKYSMPFAGWCEQYGIKYYQGFDGIDSFSEVGFSQGSDVSLFLADRNRGKYYRIVGSKPPAILDQLESVAAGADYGTYYEMRYLLGEKSENETLVPVDFTYNFKETGCSRDLEQIKGNQDLCNTMAQDYFGETFDFVRRVEEASGVTIYMYGYGQKVLTINPEEGWLEYKEETKQKKGETDFFQGLDTALSFIATHGGFETTGGVKVAPYIDSASPIDDGRGIRYQFSYRVAGEKLYFAKGNPVIVEVKNGQVTYYKRQLLTWEAASGIRANASGESAINVLAINYPYMKSVMEKLEGDSGKEENPEGAGGFELMAEEVSDISTGYLYMNGGAERETREILKPAWIVKTGKVRFFFDLYTGEAMGYEEEGE